MPADSDSMSMSRFRVHRVAAPSRPATPPGIYSLDDYLTFAGPARLDTIARPGMRAVIAFTDATRHSPDEMLVGWLLRELARCGISADDVTLLCATGLHRPITSAECEIKLGRDLAGRLRIVNHNALHSAGLAGLGAIDIEGVGTVPVVTNRFCLEADLLLATGVVEPHQYAGYSGGAKTVVIGCGGEATIQATHGPAMLDHPGTRLGAVDGNPFQEVMRRAGEMIGLDYVINVLLDENGAILASAAGAPRDVHDYLIGLGRSALEVPVERPAHIAIAGVSPAKASNLYQASRAATYLALADRTPLLPGAPIILPAAIPEGAGEGTGERRFHEILAGASSPESLMLELRRTGFPAGAQRAYILAAVLARHPVIVAGAERPDIVRACHMYSVPDLDTALALAERLARERFGIPAPAPLDLLEVPNALIMLPKLERGIDSANADT